MNVVVTFAVIGVVLFLWSYLTKRRFGLLGLALAAGSMLSTIWAPYITKAISVHGFVVMNSLTNSFVLSAIVLAPAVLILLHGAKYHGSAARFIGALLFTLLAMALLVEPLGYALPLTNQTGIQAYNWLTANKQMIIGIGLIVAVVDMFLTRPPEHHDHRRDKR
jgi:hypothetical protein